MNVRRVVTGHDTSGQAVLVSDQLVEPFTSPLGPGSEFHQLWGGDAPPEFPDDGHEPPPGSYYPAVGGFRFCMFSLPPSGDGDRPLDFNAKAARVEFEAALPGLAAHMEIGDSGMHKSATIDLELVLTGEVILELDEGRSVTLRPGDTVVQNGTRHRWSNPGSAPATIVVFMAGAHHCGP
jgi:mannose-6-phosphate isomerase-like protein (cupin superfamily)